MRKYIESKIEYTQYKYSLIRIKMHWIYILLCEDDYIYVGETTRLFRRFWEHGDGIGGLNTQLHPPLEILAIYSADQLGKFFEYVGKIRANDYNLGYNVFFNNGGILETFNERYDDASPYNLSVENNITEKLMIDRKENWKKIRGGKYVRFVVEYEFPQNDIVNTLPNCKCNLPCDVQMSEGGYFYFRCSRKNMWQEFRDEFGIENEPCNFFRKFTLDEKFRLTYEARKNAVKILVNNSPWLISIPDTTNTEQCIGGCGRLYDGNNCIRHRGRAINLCFDCFIKQHKDLKQRYNIIGFCDD